MNKNTYGKESDADIIKRAISDNTSLSFLESIIVCDCQAEILMLPDLGVMSKAIEDHIAEHKKTGKCSSKADAEYIENNLIAQIFEKTSLSH